MKFVENVGFIVLFQNIIWQITGVSYMPVYLLGQEIPIRTAVSSYLDNICTYTYIYICCQWLSGQYMYLHIYMLSAVICRYKTKTVFDHFDCIGINLYEVLV